MASAGYNFDLDKVPSPCYILDESRLRRNLELMRHVQTESGATIILAFKGFSMWKAFPIVREYLAGATASSLHEARLCFEEMQRPAHTYCVVYKESELEEIAGYSSHLTFNSYSQWEKFGARALELKPGLSLGIRVNPEFSDVETDLYNPAKPGSRLGTMKEKFNGVWPEQLEGIHCHTLCESGPEATEQLLMALEARFSFALEKVKWVNIGGGHLMTRAGYDVNYLIKVLKAFKERWNVELILEPGSAVAWDTGPLVAEILDITDGGNIKTAILDVSFTAHMPDTLEMPYRPRIHGAEAEPREGQFLYRLGGTTCLSGDFLMEYGFDQPLQVGDRIVFHDMIHYTMVKTSTFNGVGHPSIAMAKSNGTLEVFKVFGYEDFKNRLS